MEQRPFGPTGRPVPVLGQGTWRLRDPQRAQEALHLGLRLGLTHLDTAELYTGSEEAIAPVLAGRRDEVFLVSKVLPQNASRQGTLDACRSSLERLGTDHLDAYLLHWWSHQHPIQDTMHAMAHLVDEGLVRHVGASNLDVEQMEAATDALGGVPLACNQVLYHPGARDIEVEVLPHCRRHRIALVGYSPFGSGRFPGGPQAREALAAIGASHGKTARQVVLDALSRDPSVFLIPKSETPEHVRENAAALHTRLPRDALDAFDAMYPVPEHVHGVPTL